MRSKPKNTSRCGSCERSCDNEWCAVPAIIPVKLVTKEELEELYPKRRTDSEDFIYDLIRMYGGDYD
jgi:hypothetical protein